MAKQSFECEYCSFEVPLSSSRCPHCARPGLFPNVRAAVMEEEQAALEERYQLAHALARKHGAEGQLAAFEKAVEASQAVITRKFNVIYRLAQSENELYSTFYKSVEADLRLPSGGEWDYIRRVADSALFSYYEDEIRFASLSLDGRGSSHYGNCAIRLKSDMIAHRASVFEENSALFLKKRMASFARTRTVPRGFRAPWQLRSKLAAAKLADRLDRAMQPGQFPAVLARAGTTPAEDDFIEVHVWGPISIRTISSIRYSPGETAIPSAMLEELRRKLERFEVILESSE